MAQMVQRVPRVLIAGTGSGCGKTTVTCALLRALTDRGLRVGAFKCGPDYIDPMFHSRITGGRSTNLDTFFFLENTARYLLAKNGAGCGVSVIEGVMGYYDGLSTTDTGASSYELAQVTDSPVVLVVNARGASLSVLAEIHGFRSFCGGEHIRGVILNRCSAMVYPALAQAIRERFGEAVRPLGYLPPMPDCVFESRHLGLVTAGEIGDFEDKLARLARQAEQTIDIDGVVNLGESAREVRCQKVEPPRYAAPVRIAVARDRAFCFYYADSLELLKDMGAELAEFSPLEDKELPAGIHGLYLGGGYPELYTQQLAANRTMLRSVRRAVEGGLPCIAECGGFMYLTRSIAGAPMAGALPGGCFDAGKLVRFGYVTLRAKTDNLLCRAGEEIRGHEFHHWDADAPGGDFTAIRPNGRSWDCVTATRRLYAGYPHFHFYSNPAFAARFYETCLEEREANA